MNRVLIDTNVCLDVIFNRIPFSIHAKEITERSELGDFRGMLAAHSFDTIFYIIERKAGKAKAQKAIKEIRRAFGVASVNESIIDAAIRLKWKDFEDAIHHEAALASGCEAIITRNVKDFTGSELPVFKPVDFLDELNM